jgi:hypothetical protein
MTMSELTKVRRIRTGLQRVVLSFSRIPRGIRATACFTAKTTPKPDDCRARFQEASCHPRHRRLTVIRLVRFYNCPLNWSCIAIDDVPTAKARCALNGHSAAAILTDGCGSVDSGPLCYF